MLIRQMIGMLAIVGKKLPYHYKNRVVVQSSLSWHHFLDEKDEDLAELCDA